MLDIGRTFGDELASHRLKDRFADIAPLSCSRITITSPSANQARPVTSPPSSPALSVCARLASMFVVRQVVSLAEWSCRQVQWLTTNVRYTGTCLNEGW